MTLFIRHLLSMEDLTEADIKTILDRADMHRSLNKMGPKKQSSMHGRTVINLFLEPSTRTRTSFEIAGKRLGADVINMSGSGSSVVKGESLVDTAQTLDAMDADMIVVRARAAGSPQIVRRHVRGAVINAGDGKHEHPTQALLDLHTMRTSFGHFAGLKVAIVGDIAHSRVVGSLSKGLNKVGATVTVCGPPAFIPARPDALGVTVAPTIDEAIVGADVVYMLRIQRERLGQLQPLPSLREYTMFYGLTEERLARLESHAIVMHPGPMNRGVEITSGVADALASRVRDQVNSGVAVRMAIMELLTESRDKTANDVEELLHV